MSVRPFVGLLMAGANVLSVGVNIAVALWAWPNPIIVLNVGAAVFCGFIAWRIARDALRSQRSPHGGAW